MLYFFFFNDTATTEIYPLSLHGALPISCAPPSCPGRGSRWRSPTWCSTSRAPARSRSPSPRRASAARTCRSEEHTSEIQSRQYLVSRLLLEKKQKTKTSKSTHCSLTDGS